MYLLVTSHPGQGSMLEAILYRRSVLTQTATLQEALSPAYTVSPYTVGILAPHSLGEKDGAALRLRYPSLPLLAYQADKVKAPCPAWADYVLPAADRADLLTQLLLCASDFHEKDVACLMQGPLRDHLLCPYPTWAGSALILPLCERRMLRYLLCAYPSPTDVTQLALFCSRPGTTLSHASVLRHLSHINRALPYPIITKSPEVTLRLSQKERT